MPSSAANYFRVWDKYFEHLQIPTSTANLLRTYQRREKETIKDDNGKDIFSHIPKYKAFCTVPDHTNYQRVINNCFNIYFPLSMRLKTETCSVTLDFCGTFRIGNGYRRSRGQLPTVGTGGWITSALYKKPQQILPILCLVSTDRQTGKNNICKCGLTAVYRDMAIVGNDDLAAQSTRIVQ